VILAGCIVAVLICVLAAHWPVLSAQALCGDDMEYLTDNPVVKAPSFASAKRFVTEVFAPSTVGGYYQPLAMISLMLDYAAGGREEDLRVFHRTSLILHLANVALVIVLMWGLFGNPLAAAGVGLLFGLHPMTVEPVAWLTERKTLLASFFALSCLVLYVRFVRRNGPGAYIASLVAFVLALGSKPTSTPLPLCMLLMDYWPLRRLNWKALREKVPFLAIAGVSGLITFYSQRATAGVIIPDRHLSLHSPLILCHNIVFYLRKIVIPLNLTPHNPFPDPVSLSHPMVLAGVIGTFVLLVVLVISLKYSRGPLVGWAIFFVAIFPTMGVIGFTVVVAADKYAYLPSVGLLLVLGALLSWLWDAPRPARRLSLRIALGVVVVGLAAGEAVGVRKAVGHWRDTESLDRHMLTQTPDAFWVHNNYAVNLIKVRNLNGALEHVARALELNPNSHEAHNTIAVVYDMTNRPNLAVRHLERALAIKPTFWEARANLELVRARMAKRRDSPTTQPGR
jgi:hypothetical protein